MKILNTFSNKPRHATVVPGKLQGVFSVIATRLCRHGCLGLIVSLIAVPLAAAVDFDTSWTFVYDGGKDTSPSHSALSSIWRIQFTGT
ncbi:MAG: hypothetical protein GF398_16805 [Chitinivibrionales bacterium]|nr:hypothetical protein [Chitinivibrionales bacterium]